MGHYNVRDLFGHWVTPRSRAGKMCPHACCRNKRVHPANMPVVLPSRLLRRATDDDLSKHYEIVSRKETPAAEVARTQVLYEMERRDQLEQRKRDRAETRARIQQKRRERWAADKAAERMEREAISEMSYLAAEAETRGHMLSRAGQSAGIDPRSLFTGPESRARKYASEELLEHWASHARPTAAMFEGRDTRVYEKYTAPRRRGTGRRR